MACDDIWLAELDRKAWRYEQALKRKQAWLDILVGFGAVVGIGFLFIAGFSLGIWALEQLSLIR